MTIFETTTEDFLTFSNRTSETCTQKAPLTKLEDNAQSSILNYNLPQSTCFSAVGYIQIATTEDDFRPPLKMPPTLHFWDRAANLPESQVVRLLETSKKTGIQSSKVILGDFETNAKKVSPITAEEVLSIDQAINNVPINDIAKQVTQGYRPYYTRNLYGKQILKYSKQPETAIPTLVIVEHYKICSFLGDYGAGKTIKTFSLLPGEKTEITVNTYKNSSTTSTKSENVFDSFSENSTKELEQIIEDENSNTTSVGTENSQVENNESAFGVGGGINLGLPNLNLGARVDANYQNASQASNTTNTNATREHLLRQLSRALDRHVAESSAVREVEINTESSVTTEFGEETQTVRTLENINKSRVLNFVFRQLLQEYFTITYLDDISIVFSNGYPESKRVVKLNELDSLLEDSITDAEKRTTIKNTILNELSSIYDYTGTRQRFVERVTQDIVDIDDNVVGQSQYFRKKAVSQTYNGKTVPGIILDVKHRILRTDSVIADALLGQGEALDCFNMELQKAANTKTVLENLATYLQQLEKQQAITILDSIDDPELKAKLYPKVFDGCCASEVIVPVGP